MRRDKARLVDDKFSRELYVLHVHGFLRCSHICQLIQSLDSCLVRPSKRGMRVTEPLLVADWYLWATNSQG